MGNNILFDDWNVRCNGIFNRRKKEYHICSVSIGSLFLISIIGMMFHWASIVFLALSLIAYLVIWLEWLKVKNNHLVIRQDQIEVTNRFNKTTIHKIQINELVVELRHSFNQRSGGIIVSFYDKDKHMILKYEDMLNRAAPYGFEKTNWEKGLENLGVEIIDPTEIIKNK